LIGRRFIYLIGLWTAT